MRGARKNACVHFERKNNSDSERRNMQICPKKKKKTTETQQVDERI